MDGKEDVKRGENENARERERGEIIRIEETKRDRGMEEERGEKRKEE